MFSGKLQLRVVSASLAALELGRGELHCYTRITVDTRELGETEVIYASDRWIEFIVHIIVMCSQARMGGVLHHSTFKHDGAEVCRILSFG